MRKRKKRTQNFRSGALMALPIVVGYFAVGIPLGILGTQIGIPIWALVLMSIFVFAGSAQFVALQLLETGTGLIPILTATFILNLRHSLMSMSLGNAMPHVKVPLLTYLAHTITDESYGVNIMKVEDDGGLQPMSMLGTNIVAHVSWVIATLIGALIGNAIPINTDIVSGALPIMFSVLLALQLKKLEHVILVFISIGMTLAFLELLTGNWPFLVTALLVPTAATIYDSVKK